MSPRQFFDTVSKMRDAQKRYFKTRSSFDLREAKVLEKVIDDEITRVNGLTSAGTTPQQLSLF